MSRRVAISIQSAGLTPERTRLLTNVSEGLISFVRAENRLLLGGARLPFGTSIFAVARK